MKRDMEIVHQIIIQIAENDELEFTKPFSFDKEVTHDEIVYHLKIMKEAGIIDGHLTFADNKLRYYLLQLTWYGNDFAETFKNKNIWSKTKDVIKEKGFEVSNIPFDILIELGKQKLKQVLLGE